MLVLNRTVGEAIVFRFPDGRTAKLMLTEVRRQRTRKGPGYPVAKLGIEAPREIKVLREEISGTGHGEPGQGTRQG